MKIISTLPSLIIFIISLQAALGQDYQTSGGGFWHDTHVWVGNAPTYVVLGNKTPSVNANHELVGTTKLELGQRANGSLNLYNKLTLEQGLLVSKNNWEINVAFGAEFIVKNGVEFSQPSEGSASPVLTINGVARISGGIAGTGTIEGSGDLFVDFLGPNINTDHYTGTLNITQDPLPIELLSFSAQHQNDQVLLHWTTGSEINNDFFTLERSRDLYSWEVLGYVQGSGNSSVPIDYSFSDMQPLNGLAYYRLKQTDFDGKFEYFDPIAADYDMGLGGLKFKVMKNFGSWVIAMPNNGKYFVEVYCLQGLRLHSELVENTLSIPAPEGAVVIHVTDGFSRSVSRVVM